MPALHPFSTQSCLSALDWKLSHQPRAAASPPDMLWQAFNFEQQWLETCHCFWSSKAKAAKTSSCRSGGSPLEAGTHSSRGAPGGDKPGCFRWPAQISCTSFATNPHICARFSELNASREVIFLFSSVEAFWWLCCFDWIFLGYSSIFYQPQSQNGSWSLLMRSRSYNKI